MRRSRGFTLVELLVVIGIIAVLIGILMPTLAKVRREAQSTRCKAQLMQLGQGLQMYLNDNRGRFPNSPGLAGFNPDGLVPLPLLLSKYLPGAFGNAAGIYRCPADADPSVFAENGTSYYYYQELGVRDMKKTFFWAVFRNPSQMPVMWDATVYHGGKVPRNWLLADWHVDQFLSDPRPRPATQP